MSDDWKSQFSHHSLLYGDYMNMTLKKKLESLPSNPGCYLYKDNIGEIIYVGKAKNLKNRVKSYFTGSHNKKTQILVSKIEDLEYIIVNSEK